MKCAEPTRLGGLENRIFAPLFIFFKKRKYPHGKDRTFTPAASWPGGLSSIPSVNAVNSD
jgi:hypothetical protein